MASSIRRSSPNFSTASPTTRIPLYHPLNAKNWFVVSCGIALWFSGAAQAAENAPSPKEVVPPALVLRVDPSTETTFNIGERLSLFLTLTNESSHDVSLVYYAPTFWYPILKEAGTGTLIVVQGTVYNGPAQPRRLTIRQGERIRLSSTPVRFLAAPNDTNEAKAIVHPGAYLAQATVTVTQTAPTEWNGQLLSDWVSVRINGKKQ